MLLELLGEIQFIGAHTLLQQPQNKPYRLKHKGHKLPCQSSCWNTGSLLINVLLTQLYDDACDRIHKP